MGGARHADEGPVPPRDGPERSRPWYVHLAMVLGALGATTGGLNVWRAPTTEQVANATDPTAARVEVLAVEIEHLKWHVRSGGGCARPAVDEDTGPPSTLAPLPRVRK